MDYEVIGTRAVQCRTGEVVDFDSLRQYCSISDALSCSRRPIGIEVLLESDQETGEIVCRLRGKNRVVSITLDQPLSSYADNLIDEDVCYRFDNTWEEVRNILNRNTIDSECPLDVLQYIRLKKSLSEKPEIQLIDNVDISLLRKHVEDSVYKNPIDLKANLYPYQQQGVQWMDFISNQCCGFVLGDEMGLGKTLQIITLIAKQKGQKTCPSLIIAPVSLLENWKREFEKFCPSLNVFIHHGPKRTGFYKDLLQYDAVIISYGSAITDHSVLKMITWNMVVLDEAQNIKNPRAKRTKAVKSIDRRIGIAVTGTPFENHMSDLWSLLDFVVPGLMGPFSKFEKEIADSVEGAEVIEPVLTPLMIRRKVKDVAKDLPDRVDIPQMLFLDSKEAMKYERVRQEILDSFDGKNASLPMLQKLRMYCTHPYLLEEDNGGDPFIASGKYQRMCEILEEIVANGEKAILFTSYNGMFRILKDDIPRRFGIPVFSINGSTPTAQRQSIVDKYEEIEGSALIVLNPKAAGTGLNITAANHVIHYTLEWNPSLEDQASARAYRRGQKNTVFIHRLFYKDTVEQVVNERIELKRSIFNTAVIGNTGEYRDKEDIIKALLMSPGSTL